LIDDRKLVVVDGDPQVRLDLQAGDCTLAHRRVEELVSGRLQPAGERPPEGGRYAPSKAL